MAIYKNRICRECGKLFDGGPRAWYCIECRTDRRRKRDIKFKKHGAARPLGSKDICTVCGDEYIVYSGLQKYCPKCAPEAVSYSRKAFRKSKAIVENQSRKRQ